MVVYKPSAQRMPVRVPRKPGVSEKARRRTVLLCECEHLLAPFETISRQELCVDACIPCTSQDLLQVVCIYSRVSFAAARDLCGRARPDLDALVCHGRIHGRRDLTSCSRCLLGAAVS